MTDDEGEGGRMCQFCAIVDKRGVVTLGQGPAYQLPKSVIDRVRDGVPLLEAERRVLNVDKIEDEVGMAGHVSAGFANRRQLTETSVLMALMPRLRPDLYANLWKENP